MAGAVKGGAVIIGRAVVVGRDWRGFWFCIWAVYSTMGGRDGGARGDITEVKQGRGGAFFYFAP